MVDPKISPFMALSSRFKKNPLYGLPEERREFIISQPTVQAN